MRIYDFKEQLQKQQAMFDSFVTWLKSRDNVVGVTLADEQDDRNGIDLWAIVKDENKAVPIQVKVDFRIRATGNIAAETVGQMRWSGEWRPGWLSLLHNTRLLVYLCGHTGTYRIYDSQEFFEHVVTNYSCYRSFIAMNGSRNGGDFWYGIGVKVPTSNVGSILLDGGSVKEGSGELVLKRREERSV